MSRKLYSVAVALILASLAATSAHASNQQFRQLQCLHAYETGLWWRNHTSMPLYVAWRQRWHIDTGNGQANGLQFTLWTWNSVPGRKAKNIHEVAKASRREQVRRALLVWKRDGKSWREWSTAPLCGLS